MIPQDDWMVLKLYEPKRDTGIVLPDTMDKVLDDSAVFEIVSMGPGLPGQDQPLKGKVGDIVLLEGATSVYTVKLPNGKKVCVGKNRDVAFVLGERDLAQP